MVTENFKCEECGYIIENVEAESGDKFPKRIDCPKCNVKESCYRMWGVPTTVIGDHMRAVPKDSGVAYAYELMKSKKRKTKYEWGQSSSK